MKSIINQVRFKAILTLALCCMVSVANADDPDKLPAAKSILKKFADESGGADNYRKIKTVKMTGKLKIKEQSLDGTVEMQIMVPDKVRFKLEIPNVIVDENGSDGKTVWAHNSIQGARILEGKEKAQLLEEASFEKVYNPEKYYKDMKVVGTDEIDGEKCYKLNLTKQSDIESTEFYSMKTGLHLRTEAVVPSPLGDIPITIDFSEMKDVGGVKMPYKISRKMNGMNVVVEFDKIEMNPKIDASVFTPPEEVMELVEE